jgi:hypothetical protein
MTPEERISALEIEFSRLRVLLEQTKRYLPESEQLNLACHKFGYPVKAIGRRGRSSHLLVARNAVIRELFASYGWTVTKICQVMTLSYRQVLRVIS